MEVTVPVLEVDCNNVEVVVTLTVEDVEDTEVVVVVPNKVDCSSSDEVAVEVDVVVEIADDVEMLKMFKMEVRTCVVVTNELSVEIVVVDDSNWETDTDRVVDDIVETDTTVVC